MNRLQWGNGSLLQGEREIIKQGGIRIYDGEQKTGFEDGELQLTNYRLIWRDKHSGKRDLFLHLSVIVFAEEENGGWKRSAKIIAHLTVLPEGEKPSGPIQYSPYNYVKFSFTEGKESEFFKYLRGALEKKEWEQVITSYNRKYRAGIVGIERQIQARNKEVDRNISAAFEDLKNLMDMAKVMVHLSKNISQKIREKKGEISEDETVQFKSHLLSLGISDPVTKETHGSGYSYHTELAKQLVEVLEKPLEEAGGVLSLTDVYCRINRARGLELISPEDLFNACKMLNVLRLPLRMQTFDSGVKIVKLASFNDQAEAAETKRLVEDKGSLTADELAGILELSVILSKEKLLSAERIGYLCRDDSVEGLKFYPNLFITD